ncbi:MAG: hypothetical protein ACI934_001009 [Pseudohongiellaceae bacterium]|jgi:uncharacterized protein (DUF2141 family)
MFWQTFKAYPGFRKLSFFCLCVVSVVTYAQQGNLTLTVEAGGAEPGQGQALFDLFDSEDNFLSEPLISLTASIDNEGQAIFVLPELNAGTYAFSVIYDEDSDGELKTGFLGIPKEKVAVSNNARPRFGPPSYKDAVFTLSESISMSVRFGDAQ